MDRPERSVLAFSMLFVMLNAGCGSSAADWRRLAAGVHARTIYAWPGDPEHLYVYRSLEALSAAEATDPDPRKAQSRDVDEEVTVAEVAPAAAEGKHFVRIVSASGWSGWVVAERALLPIPPPHAQLDVPGSETLYPEEDDDDAGKPFEADSQVTLLDFTRDPGNPEYHVHVDSGPLAGETGYLSFSELREPGQRPFVLR